MEDDTTNTAQRLLEILKAARAQPNGQTRAVWSKVLNCESARDLTWLLLALQVAVDEVEEIVRASVSDREFQSHSQCFPPIRQALSIVHLGHDWDGVKAHLTPEVLARLEFCTHVVERTEAEAPLDKDARDKLLESLDGWEKEIRDSDLPLPLRRLLLRKLSDVRMALLHYEIVGASGVRAAVSNAMGAMMERGREVARAWDSSAIRAYVQMINAVGLVVNAPDLLHALSWMGEKGRMLLP